MEDCCGATIKNQGIAGQIYGEKVFTSAFYSVCKWNEPQPTQVEVEA